jgi:hypothetical protein
MYDGMRSDEREREDAEATGACAGVSIDKRADTVANLVAGGER